MNLVCNYHLCTAAAIVSHNKSRVAKSGQGYTKPEAVGLGSREGIVMVPPDRIGGVRIEQTIASISPSLFPEL